MPQALTTRPSSLASNLADKEPGEAVSDLCRGRGLACSRLSLPGTQGKMPHLLCLSPVPWPNSEEEEATPRRPRLHQLTPTSVQQGDGQIKAMPTRHPLPSRSSLEPAASSGGDPSSVLCWAVGADTSASAPWDGLEFTHIPG